VITMAIAFYTGLSIPKAVGSKLILGGGGGGAQLINLNCFRTFLVSLCVLLIQMEIIGGLYSPAS
jgi:hypothetical protein